MSSETESEPFQDSGSDYVPSDLGQPSTSKSSDKRPIMTKKKRVRRSLVGKTTKEKRGKKRVRRESDWQRNMRKKLKACGEEHVNSVKKFVPKRTVGAPCTCRLKCFDKITEAQRMSIVTYDFYNRIFLLNHNISFGTPRSDTCQTCDRLHNLMLAELDPENKKALQTKKHLHIRKSEMFYKKLKEVTALSKEDETTEVLCFDFQQNLPLPHVPAGDVFYKRQLWEYNFCIHSGKMGTSTFYMYDEHTAKKGSNEVISFLHHYIETYLPVSVNKLYIFSDNAFAQNKNQTLMKYLFTLVNQNARISEIYHQYPEPGHSFLPCDRSFGLIEKNKRKKERVYLPSEWIKLVQDTSKKFIVVPVEQGMILNFSDHFKQLIKSAPKGPKKEKFAISTYRLMKYTKNNKFIECSVSSGLPNYTKFSINVKEDIPLSMPDNKAYFTSLDINPKKLKDLKDLVRKYVPLNDQGYYNRIFQNITVDGENPNSGHVNEDQDAEDQDSGNVSDASYV